MVEAPHKSDAGTEKPDPRVGTVLAERYRLDRLLGIGGMGRVYAAEHVLMRKRLAVKVLHRELTRVPDVVARFEREAMAAANIDHPNIAAATDFGKLSDGAVFLVLEYVSGRSLRDEISAGPMPPARALHIAKQIASTLAAAHALNIVHRDLKPENVMLVEKGSDRDFVKVLDFGIAKVPFDEISERGSLRPGQKITKAGMVFGTPEYMAPEQALAQQVDGRADLYALGVILFEMLAGVRPFSSATQVGILGQQLSLPVPRIADRAPGVTVPPQLEHLLQTLLARDASERYASASELVDLLEQLRGVAPTHSRQLFTLARGSGLLPSDASSPESVLLEKAAHMADSTNRSKVPDDSQASAPAPVASPQAPASAPARAAPAREPPSAKVEASRPPLAATRPASSPLRPPLSASRPPLAATRPASSPSRPPLSARPPLRPSRPPPSASRPPLRLSRPPPAPSSRRPKLAPPEPTRDDAHEARPQAEPQAVPPSADRTPALVAKADAPALGVASTADTADAPALGVASTTNAADAPALGVASTADAADAPALGVASTTDAADAPALGVASTADAAPVLASTAHGLSDNEPKLPLGGPAAPSDAGAAPLDEPFEIPLTPSLGRWVLGVARAPVVAWNAMRARRSSSAALDGALATESPKTTEPVRAGALRSALAGVPLPAVIAGVVLFVAVSVAGVLFLSGRWHGSPPSPPPGAKGPSKQQVVRQKPASAKPSPPAVATPSETAPSPEELAKARESGSTALRSLSERYPRDGRTVLELAKSLRRDEQFSEVPGALARALSIDPKLSSSGEVATLLWQAAQKSESRAQAFALLEDSMEARGLDIAYDLVTTEGIQPVVKQKAGQLLNGDRFEQQASEALKVAVALRAAKDCKAQRSLIGRAEKSGDRRSVPYLKDMQKSRCVVGRDEHRLRAAIEAIQRRPRR